MSWEKLWETIRQRVDGQKNRRVTLTVLEIRLMTGTHQNIDKPWWWKLASSEETGNDVRLQDSGLDWSLQVRSGQVHSVTFTRQKQNAP